MCELPFPALQRSIRCQYKACEEMPLLLFLANRFKYLSSSAWLAQIEDGNLSVAHRRAQPEQILRPGEIVEFTPRNLQEPPVSWDILPIHEDDQMLIVSKPANLPCHPAGAFFNHTLWAWLKQYKKLPEIHLCNRLDRETSGLCIVCKNSLSARQVNFALQQPECCKKYLVLVWGEFPSERDCMGWLIPDKESQIRKKRAFTEATPDDLGTAVTAHTSFLRLAYSEDANISLLQAIIKTGRTHQIRGTLCSLGFPIVGDKLYGKDENLFLKFLAGETSDFANLHPLLSRQALHSWEISFRLSGTAACHHYRALPPEDFSLFLASINIPTPQ